MVAPLFYYVTTIKIKYPTRLTVLFPFTPKRKSLTTLTTLLYFTNIKMESLTPLTRLFYFVTTIKMKSLTTHTKFFYFTNIQIKTLITLTALFKFTTINTFTPSEYWCHKSVNACNPQNISCFVLISIYIEKFSDISQKNSIALHFLIFLCFSTLVIFDI